MPEFTVDCKLYFIYLSYKIPCVVATLIIKPNCKLGENLKSYIPRVACT
jgi:hypothetical protein